MSAPSKRWKKTTRIKRYVLALTIAEALSEAGNFWDRKRVLQIACTMVGDDAMSAKVKEAQ